MAEEIPAVAPAKAPVKAPAKTSKKKTATPRPRKDGPTLSKLIIGAVSESKERKGVSLNAVKKHLAAQGLDVTKSNRRINSTVTRLVTNGTLNQTKGTGASGSFKIAQKEPKAVKPAKKVVKKAPVKAKKPAAKKTAAAKKPVAKKAVAKKSPKKVPAKKAVKKAVVKKTTPKKAPVKKAVKKTPVKKTPVKKAPAKKAPVKKAAAKKTKK